MKREECTKVASLYAPASCTTCISPAPLGASARTAGWPGPGTMEGFGEYGESVGGTMDGHPELGPADREAKFIIQITGEWVTADLKLLQEPLSFGKAPSQSFIYKAPILIKQFLVNFHFLRYLTFYEPISYKITLTDQDRNYHLSSNPPGRALMLPESNNIDY